MMSLERVNTLLRFIAYKAKQSSYLAYNFCTSRCTHHARGSLERDTQDAKQCPYFTKFQLTIETVHRADNGQSENVHGLSKEILAARDVEIVDIASSARDYWSYVDTSSPVMTAYKLVTIDAIYWGFGYKLEQAFAIGMSLVLVHPIARKMPLFQH
ncbi:hypothetical protein J5N97_000125 [Dioscorea zingiberensis]|uniref:Phosphatidylinositol transfer protein N-terminal domain-containing protein n=1 Tax=Dioscorea zingiberensis TaxID=325984 RepID=A0A9D5H1P6_9LILI|nr:hypothetical protein J5N97_000125 [Dioscorea zingiberensis]